MLVASTAWQVRSRRPELIEAGKPRAARRVTAHTDYSYEEVGIQVPAGSVRAGETPEDAALREATEETGESAPTHFECFWVPLEAAHILQSGQGALLGRLFD